MPTRTRPTPAALPVELAVDAILPPRRARVTGTGEAARARSRAPAACSEAAVEHMPGPPPIPHEPVQERTRARPPSLPSASRSASSRVAAAHPAERAGCGGAAPSSRRTAPAPAPLPVRATRSARSTGGERSTFPRPGPGTFPTSGRTTAPTRWKGPRIEILPFEPGGSVGSQLPPVDGFCSKIATYPDISRIVIKPGNAPDGEALIRQAFIDLDVLVQFLDWLATLTNWQRLVIWGQKWQTTSLAEEFGGYTDTALAELRDYAIRIREVFIEPPQKKSYDKGGGIPQYGGLGVEAPYTLFYNNKAGCDPPAKIFYDTTIQLCGLFPQFESRLQRANLVHVIGYQEWIEEAFSVGLVAAERFDADGYCMWPRELPPPALTAKGIEPRLFGQDCPRHDYDCGSLEPNIHTGYLLAECYSDSENEKLNETWCEALRMVLIAMSHVSWVKAQGSNLEQAWQEGSYVYDYGGAFIDYGPNNYNLDPLTGGYYFPYPFGLEYWFGVIDDFWTNIDRISAVISALWSRLSVGVEYAPFLHKSIVFNCNKVYCKNEAAVAGHDVLGIVHLCPKFFDRPVEERAGALLHELLHHFDEFQLDDLSIKGLCEHEGADEHACYGAKNALLLAPTWDYCSHNIDNYAHWIGARWHAYKAGGVCTWEWATHPPKKGN